MTRTVRSNRRHTLVPNARAGGFSLIEIIGVLAIMAILAAAITPNLVRQINNASDDAEKQNLRTFADALVTYIETNKRIPGMTRTDWPAAIAEIASVPEASVLHNERGYRRRYYVDPRFFTSTDRRFRPFVQQRGLSTAPVSARIMLVSVMTQNAPNIPGTFADFDAIWEQSASARVVEGGAVHIQRINLNDLFQRVVLVNDLEVRPSYRIEGGPATNLALASAGGRSGLTRYMIRGSKLELLADSGNLDRAMLIHKGLSATYADATGVARWDMP